MPSRREIADTLNDLFAMCASTVLGLMNRRLPMSAFSTTDHQTRAPSRTRQSTTSAPGPITQSRSTTLAPRM